MDLLTEYQKRLAELAAPWGRAAVFIFRGQRNGSWALNSSAERRLEKESNPPALIDYLTKVLMEPARSEGYAHQHNRELNDLELLAKLQHFGAATCLIDFTANFHIALWFACADDKADGKVFVVNRGDTHNFKEVTLKRAKEGIATLLQPPTTTLQTPSHGTSAGAKEGIKELLQSHTIGERFASSESQPEFYYWQPPANENRMVVQHSCFIFSARPIDPVIYREISISKEHKQEIRMLLQKFYGINTQSIFRDFGGFAASQGQEEPITPAEPASAEQSLRSANEHFQQGKNQEAVADYDQAIRLNPQYTEAYYNRGTAKSMLGRHQEAIADYNEAIRLNPQVAQTYTNRGNAKVALGRHQEAMADYDEAIRINPQAAEAFFNRGNVKCARGLCHDGIADFDQVIRLNPQDAEAYNNRGNAKDELGWHEEAIADFDQAIRINPQTATVYSNRGIANAALGRHEQAIVDFDRAIGLNPQHATAYSNRGSAKGTLGRHKDALADFNEAIRINPENATAYGNRGNAKALLGRPEEAITDYNQSIRLNPHLADVYCNRGFVYKEIREYKKARADLQRAFELASEQGYQALAEIVRRFLDDLPPAGSAD